MMRNGAQADDTLATLMTAAAVPGFLEAKRERGITLPFQRSHRWEKPFVPTKRSGGFRARPFVSRPLEAIGQPAGRTPKGCLKDEAGRTVPRPRPVAVEIGRLPRSSTASSRRVTDAIVWRSSNGDQLPRSPPPDTALAGNSQDSAVRGTVGGSMLPSAILRGRYPQQPTSDLNRGKNTPLQSLACDPAVFLDLLMVDRGNRE